jgi:FAD/FMN-containing dehydrogenase
MTLLDDIVAVVGERGVLTGADVSGRSAGWARPHETIDALAIVRPASTEEASKVLALCNAAGQSVVTHGGLTGLVRGGDSSTDDIVLSLERMTAVEEVDADAGTMTVQAGVTLQTAQEAADAAGFVLPLDLGGRGSATIGGNIATNAGGNRVVRYGMTREMVLGLEVVLADGQVMSSLNKVIKDNAGYNLKQLFIGSEGTLGLVTRAVLRLRPKPNSQQTAIVAVSEFSAMPRLLNDLNRRLGGAVTAFEAMWSDFYELITVGAGRTPPVATDYPFYVLVEAMGGDEAGDQERFEAALGEVFEAGLIADAAIAKSQAERDAMWAMRDDVGQLRQQWGPLVAFDVSLPAMDMEAYLAEADAPILARWPDRRRATFGHLGDGNLHIGYAVGEVTPEVREFIDESVYKPLAAFGGSVSAEHGIGLEKKDYLHLTRSELEIGLMRRVKAVFDPHNILNPGKVF